MTLTDLETCLAKVRACRTCEADLPLGPRPVVRIAPGARLLIIGQAPGTKVHESGIPWNDASGDRLRDWLNIDHDVFYDPSKVAIMPMGFCYPGRDPKGGDLPPRPECAPQWHDTLLNFLPGIELTILVGSYAQKRYLAETKSRTMTDTVRDFRKHLETGYLPTPHPSWRTTAWQKKNPWFDTDLLPVLRERAALLVA
ncbi:uracil-DNA glycosylase family protein [Hwanghaeella grinnelliae]|uniref:Uracil-DNA glycosylase family protein n=1 Tax=Hwanghaeella grinnelliae TaxID=2500179 RepID=A0A437QPV9_9PROT|nr:uracil-DNA glycosylase family protein [Hwanghaeella grinnelliae]RVU36535.1 uracil-DNA glycosylase family protein [Hwanghaeella grinnelliae]